MNCYLFVYYVENLEESKQFYQALGMTFVSEKHGNGPFHCSTNVNGMVFELYPVNEKKGKTVTRLGLNLSGQNVNLPSFIDTTEISILDNGKKYCVLQDPSGNSVEIVW